MLQENQSLKDRYKNSFVNIYDLCVYMNNRASILLALHYTLTKKDRALLELVQSSLISNKEFIDSIDNPSNQFDDLELDYEIYMYNCLKCNGEVKVIDFEHNKAGHEFNVYRCEVCGAEKVDKYPNKQEHVIAYFDIIIKWLEEQLSDKKLAEDEKLKHSKQLRDIKKEKKLVYNENESIIKKRDEYKKMILSTIEKGEDFYKDLLKSKHLFDRNISEA